MRTLARTTSLAALAAALAGCIHLAGTAARPAVGRPAPDTRGADSLGEPLQLADYRRQVVLLEFWRWD
jgi:hypothetical protein